MNRYIRMTIALLALSASALALAEQNQDAERAALQAMLGSIESALNEKSFDRVVPLLDENAVVIFLNGEVTRGIEQARAYFDKTLGQSNPILSDYRTSASVGAPARFIGDIAIADGSTQDTFVFAQGSEMVVDTKWTVTLEKQGDAWKILQLQFSSNLFDNPLVASAKNNLLLFAGMAVVAGLAIGFLLGRRRRVNA